MCLSAFYQSICFFRMIHTFHNCTPSTHCAQNIILTLTKCFLLQNSRSIFIFIILFYLEFDIESWSTLSKTQNSLKSCSMAVRNWILFVNTDAKSMENRRRKNKWKNTLFKVARTYKLIVGKQLKAKVSSVQPCSQRRTSNLEFPITSHSHFDASFHLIVHHKVYTKWKQRYVTATNSKRATNERQQHHSLDVRVHSFHVCCSAVLKYNKISICRHWKTPHRKNCWCRTQMNVFSRAWKKPI